MNQINAILDYIRAGLTTVQISTDSVLAVLLMTVALSIYEYIIYRVVSKRSFYSKQFNIVLAVMPLFISTIIMTLQSNLLITLGTIGALAIIRFRTAVKDPIDLLYLLWSLHIGIVCGCGLYGVGILTSIAATLLLLILDILPFGKAPFLLVVDAHGLENEPFILRTIAKTCRYHKVKAKNIGSDKLNIIVEVRTKNEHMLLKEVKALEGVDNLSLVSYDGENFS